MSNFTKEYIVTVGQMGNHYYFCLTISMEDIARLFIFDEAVVPEAKAQRELSPSRAKKISKYIQENRTSYVFSSLVAFCAGEITYNSIDKVGDEEYGKIILSSENGLNWLDGQHRWYGIMDAIATKPVLKKDKVPVIVFPQTKLPEAQQMFSDLNGHGSKPNKSVVTAFNHRDDDAVLSNKVIQKISLFRRFTDSQRTSVKKSSSLLFSRSAIHEATKKLTSPLADHQLEYAIGFWNSVAINIPEWTAALKGVDTREIRLLKICTHNIVLAALGEIGSLVYVRFQDGKGKYDFTKMEEFFKPLALIDWTRTNPDWKNRILSHTGAIQANSQSLKRLVIYLKFHLKMRMDKEEIEMENAYSDLLKTVETPPAAPATKTTPSTNGKAANAK